MYQQFFVLFAIMFAGYFLRKFDIIDYNMNRGLNRFIVYFSFPCLILEKIGTFPMDGTTMNLFYIVFGIGFALFAVYAGIAFLYVKARPVSYTHLRAHETRHDLVCRLLLEQ